MRFQLLHSLGRAAGDAVHQRERPAVLALSLCTGVTRGPGPHIAVCQWALLYCGRHHCCAGCAGGQKGVVCSRAPAMCSCLRTRKARCRMPTAAWWQQGAVPCCQSLPCAEAGGTPHCCGICCSQRRCICSSNCSGERSSWA